MTDTKGKGTECSTDKDVFIHLTKQRHKYADLLILEYVPLRFMAYGWCDCCIHTASPRWPLLYSAPERLPRLDGHVARFP